MPGDSDRAKQLKQRQQQAFAQGITKGLKQAVAKDAERDGVTLAEAAEAYAQAIGEGVLVKAIDRPHDASRALAQVANMARLVEPPQRMQMPAGGVWQINIGDSVVESMRRDGYELGDIVDADSTGGG
jgi:hypothetical protein